MVCYWYWTNWDRWRKDKGNSRLAKTSKSVNVKSFHGLGSFYKRSMKDFSSLAAPLTEAIQKNTSFKGGGGGGGREQENAFFD